MVLCVCRKLRFKRYQQSSLAMSTISQMKSYVQNMEAEENHIKNHCYKQLARERSKQELSDELMESIVHNDNGIICFNKPYGIRSRPLKEKPGTQKLVQTLFSSAYESSLSMEQCASENLKSLLKTDALLLTKTCERYMSGICSFTSSEENKKEMEKCFLRSTAQKAMPYTFLAVTLGIPTVEDTIDKLGYILKLVDENTGEKSPFILQSFSKARVLTKEITSVHARCTVLSTNHDLDVSLLRISTNTKKWHFPRVYATYKGAAVLGDNIHGQRVQKLFNKTITVNDVSKLSMEPKKIPEMVSQKLQLRKRLLPFVPVHLHLHQLTLTKFRKKKDLVLTAPLPPHFTWSLQQLGLDFKDD